MKSAPLDNFTRGILADAFREGQRQWWLKRAEDFERAKPKSGDFHGRATREELSRRWQWLDGVERACRAKAEMVRFDDDVETLLTELGGAA